MESTVAYRTEQANGQPADVSAADDDRVPEAGHVPDGELIRRFVTQQDEAAFREIVRRYTPLVMGVALRTTHDPQAAEDVLQATFLVLVEKAESLDDPTQIAAWLHGVAMRIARRLVDKRHRHREQPHRHENHVMSSATATDPFERVCQTRDHDVLGEELQRLPEKYRTPMVLRYLEDLTNEQVAERLGLKVSTIEGRLKRGKKELRRRLARRGVTLGAAMLVWNMTQQALAAAPVANLADLTATTALAWQSPTPALAPPTDAAMSLAQQEITLMSTLKLTTAGTLAGTVLLGAGLLVAMTGAEEGPALQTAAAGLSLIDTTVIDTTDDAAPPEPAAAALASTDDEPPAERIAPADATAEDGTTDEGTTETDYVNLDVEVGRAYALKSVDAEAMMRVIDALYPGAYTRGHETGLSVAADADKNLLIVRGTPQKQIRALINAIDGPDSAILALDGSSRGMEREQRLERINGIAQGGDAAADASVASNMTVNGETVPGDDHALEEFRAFALKFVRAEEMVDLVDRLAGASARSHENLLLVRGTPDQHEMIEAIIKAIDQAELKSPAKPLPAVPDGAGLRDTTSIDNSAPAESADIKIFQLAHADAESAVQMLKELISSSDGQLEGVGDVAPPSLSVDARTNSILAYGNRDTLHVIEAILLRIDQPVEADGDYQLGSGDVLSLYVEGFTPSKPIGGFHIRVNENGALVWPVGNDGEPLLPTVDVAGLTVEQATERIRKSYTGVNPSLGKRTEYVRLKLVKRRSDGPAEELTEPTAGSATEKHEHLADWSDLARRLQQSQHRFDITQRSQAEEKIRRTLQAPINVSFSELPLLGALQEIARRHDVPLIVDELALQQAGVSPHETIVTLHLRHMPTDLVLELLFRQVRQSNAETPVRDDLLKPAAARPFNDDVKLTSGDVLAVFIETVLHNPVHRPWDHDPNEWKAPTDGYPVPIREAGTLLLPLIPPIEVDGLTLREATDRIRDAYTRDQKILPEGRDRIHVSLLKRRNASPPSLATTPVAYLVEQGSLIVTTREIAEQTMQVWTYDLRPFDQPGVSINRATVVEAVRTMTGEGTWAEQGGRGTLVEGGSTLTVRQSPLVHREIEALLEQLLHAAEATAEPGE